MTENITTSYHSYPSPKAMGHAMIKELLFDTVIVEEKLDVSQFSFGVFGPERELRCRSKGAQINMFAPEKMFIPGIETARELAPMLTEGWTYRCEYFQKPKHNVLVYGRIPQKHLMLIDINYGHEQYLEYEDKVKEGERLGLETTPLLYHGIITDPFMIRDFLDRTSILGGPKIEGVVVKNYRRFTMDGKVQMGKFVSEEFKEVHATGWKETNPDNKDIVQVLIAKYKTPARWMKAVQHLKEAGKIAGEMSDMQFIFPEVLEDTRKECEEEIKQLLFNWAWKNIGRSLTGGLPEWYREQLLKNQEVHE
jgi:hypothetical protein